MKLHTLAPWLYGATILLPIMALVSLTGIAQASDSQGTHAEIEDGFEEPTGTLTLEE